MEFIFGGAEFLSEHRRLKHQSGSYVIAETLEFLSPVVTLCSKMARVPTTGLCPFTSRCIEAITLSLYLARFSVVSFSNLTLRDVMQYRR